MQLGCGPQETVTDADVGVDGCVSGGAGEVLVLSVGNVEVTARVPVLFRQPEIDDVDDILASPKPNLHRMRMPIRPNHHREAGHRQRDRNDMRLPRNVSSVAA